MVPVLAAMCLSCDSRSTKDATPPPGIPIVWGTATLKGKVHFIGTPPVMRMIPNQPCCDGAEPFSEETVVVDTGGGLANTFVYLEGIAASDGSPLPQKMMDQKDCRFVPHVIGVAVGEKLAFHSSDPTLHNVNYSPAHSPAHNFAMTQAGAESITSFTAAEFIRVHCDVHPWMIAWVGVFDNPFFTVTAPDGSFEIDKVPAGTYKLVAWHEQYGRMEQAITITQGQVVDEAFGYKAP